MSALEPRWVCPRPELVRLLCWKELLYSCRCKLSAMISVLFLFSIFTTVSSVGNVTLPRSAPSTSLCSSTIINASFYFCRLYRRRRKETNKNCSRAKFTPDKQHPRGDLTLQFALTHTQANPGLIQIHFQCGLIFANQSCGTK